MTFLSSDPPLDPRYLSKRDDAIALRGVSSTRSASPPSIHSGLPSHIGRMSQHHVVIPKATHQAPPLASAYFPGQKGSWQWTSSQLTPTVQTLIELFTCFPNNDISLFKASFIVHFDKSLDVWKPAKDEKLP